MKLGSILLLLIGTSQATIEIHDRKIKKEVAKLDQFLNKIEHNPAYKSYNEALEEARVKAKINIQAKQKELLQPIIENLQSYQEYFTPDAACQTTGLATCLNKYVQLGEPAELHWKTCAAENNCQIKFEQIPFQKKMELEQKLGKNKQQLQRAVQQLSMQIGQDFKQAMVKEQNHRKEVESLYKNEAKTLLLDWGCNTQCIDKYTTGDDFKVKLAIAKCQCPAAVQKVNEIEIDDETFLTAAKGSNTAPKAGEGISIPANLNAGTWALIGVFILQLMFCFCICCYTQHQVKLADQRSTKQQAEFYQFLYNFHKQMADEEHEMNIIYGQKVGMEKGQGGGTPGGPDPSSKGGK